MVGSDLLQQNSGESNEGVYYAREDYAGFGRRLLVLVVDGAAMVAGCAVLSFLVPFVISGWYFTRFATLIVWGIATFSYLVMLKRTGVRTLGYRMAGVRIVDLHGDPPPWSRLLFRLLFLQFTIASPALDVLWMAIGPHKQALRDFLAGTYVVRSNAVPIGRGPIQLRHLFACTYSFTYPGVARQTPETRLAFAGLSA